MLTYGCELGTMTAFISIEKERASSVLLCSDHNTKVDHRFPF